MKHLEKTKMILGYILIGISLVGMLVAFSFQFDWDWFVFRPDAYSQYYERELFNSPIFYGLMAIAGAILLATVKKEEK